MVECIGQNVQGETLCRATTHHTEFRTFTSPNVDQRTKDPKTQGPERTLLHLTMQPTANMPTTLAGETYIMVEGQTDDIITLAAYTAANVNNAWDANYRHPSLNRDTVQEKEGASPYTVLPGAAYISNSQTHQAFGSTLLQAGEFLKAFVFLGKHRHQAPRAFHLLKWKTCEHLADWRWRLAVSHKFHPLRRTSRLIGRCLSLLLREFHIAFPLWGSPSMIISRDMHFMMRSHGRESLSLWERDINNAFWNLDKEKVLQGIKQACNLVKSYRKITGDVFFNIAKGNPKSLDGMGKATAKHFRIVSIGELLSFVDWDMKETCLTCGASFSVSK